MVGAEKGQATGTSSQRKDCMFHDNRKRNSGCRGPSEGDREEEGVGRPEPSQEGFGNLTF